MNHETIDSCNAKSLLSSLIERVAQGESFLITRHGEPVAELRPVEEATPRARRGCANSSRFHMDADFDAPIKDFQ